MEAAKVIRNRSDMTDRYFETLYRMVRSQAYRELAASEVMGYAVRFAPDLDAMRHIVHHVEEEMEHYEACLEMFAQISDHDLDTECRQLLRTKKPIPLIESYLEFGCAQLLYDRASAYQLREYENSSFDPYCRMVGKILEEEEGHESFGAEVLIAHCRDESVRPAAQLLFGKWLSVSLLSFGRPGSPGNRYAVSVGLKTRDSGDIQQEYLDGLKPTMRLCGLTFPTREELGIELAPHIDLNL